MHTKFVSTDAGWSRIFSNYKPVWIIVFLLIFASISGATFPGIGICTV